MKIARSLAASFACAAVAFQSLCASAAGEPHPYDAATLATLGTVVSAARASDYAYAQDEFLSDAIGPRLSGSSQAEAAARYVAGKLRALGLAVRLEPVMVHHWVRGEETGALTDWPGRMTSTQQKVVLTALGESVATPAAGIDAPVVVVDDFAQLKALGDRVRGKIVLFNVKFDKRLAAASRGGDAYGQLIGYRFAGPSAAARQGAVATLLRSLGSADYRLPHTGGTGYEPGVPKIPAAAVAVEDAELMARLAKNGPVTMHLVLTPKTLPDAKSENVIADLPGTADPQHVVIVSGHIDSWDLGTGATDDGAGVAQAMGVMDTLVKLGLRPRRTIRCIAWMNEENGVAGGRTYAVDEKAHLADTVAAIESDSGAAYPIGFSTTLSRASEPYLEPIAEVLGASGSPHISYAEGSETDVGPIVALGVPAYAPVQDDPHYFDYHHTAADTIDKVDPQGIAGNTAVLAALAWGLANAAELPAREPVAPDAE